MVANSNERLLFEEQSAQRGYHELGALEAVQQLAD
jgi:hypothetical protein